MTVAAVDGSLTRFVEVTVPTAVVAGLRDDAVYDVTVRGRPGGVYQTVRVILRPTGASPAHAAAYFTSWLLAICAGPVLPCADPAIPPIAVLRYSKVASQHEWGRAWFWAIRPASLSG